MLVRWNNSFEDLFVDFFNVKKNQWAPDVEIKEEEKEFVINVELPGIDNKDVKVEVKGKLLTIEVEKKNRMFARSFTLPPSVDSEKIEALLDKGVLTIKISKTPEKVSRKVEIKVNGPPNR